MKKLRLLLSFDHELSLGGADSYANNMFDPTDRLIDLADELDVPITLFTDVCCAIRFRRWDARGFFDPFRRQVEVAIDRGHDVQLHLHPHWMDTEYRDGRFFPARTYSLGDFHDREWPNNISGIVQQGVELLNELCRPVRPDYRCVAFRAGGCSMAPRTTEILEALYENGIRIESSIAKGFQYGCELWKVDYRNMPGSANWFISPSGPLNREATSGLYEIPIAARPRTPVNNIPFLFKRVLYRNRQYATGGRSIDVGATSVIDKLKRLAPHSTWMLGFDNHTESVADVMRTLKSHIRSHSQEDEITCSVISHPKFMGDYARSVMKSFVERVRAEFCDRVSFCNYQQFYYDFLSVRGCAEDAIGGV